MSALRANHARMNPMIKCSMPPCRDPSVCDMNGQCDRVENTLLADAGTVKGTLRSDAKQKAMHAETGRVAAKWGRARRRPHIGVDAEGRSRYMK
jgi:hypothetical protein